MPPGGSEIQRRVLLGVITALIVARPLVLGEDPGLLVYRLSDSSNLWLTFLWLLAGVGWAGWRVWSGQGAWHGSWVERGLLLVVGLVFLSTFFSASYRHPALLISWEWLVLLVVFCLVRQLARSPGDNHRLLAALLASAISLSAYAIYQYTVEFPDQRNYLLTQTEKIKDQLAEKGISLAEDDPKLEAWTKRIQEDNVFATYAHPNSFAGYLVLLFPAAIGTALMYRNRQGWSWKTVLSVVGLVLMATALGSTHSRGAILGAALVAAAVVIGRMKGKRKIAVSLALGAALILGGVFVWNSGLGAVDLVRKSMEKRLDYWQATWAMIIDGKYPWHFWLGVGQGNFNRFYPRYMSPSAHEEVMDPHNFVVEMWATSGIFAMLALLGVFGLFFWKTRQAWSGKVDATLGAKPGAGNTQDSENRFGTRWEFYLGGVGGLILGFILSKFDLFSDPNLTWNGFLLVLVGSCVRSLIWFAVFALMETVPWTAPVKRLVLTGGFAALLLNLSVSGGISFPSVAQPMWGVAGLAINSMTGPKVIWHTRNWLGKVFPLPVLAAGSLLYLFLVLIPVNQCFRYLKAAQSNYSRWPAMDAKWRNSLKQEANIQEAHRVTFDNTNFIQNILRLLRKANDHDSLNVVPVLDSALWEGELWKLKSDVTLREHATGLALSAVRLDPESSDPYYTLYQLNLLFAQFTETKKKEFWEQAAKAIKEVVQRNPSNLRIRYHYAEILFRADDPVEGKVQARRIRRMDEMAIEPVRKLTPQQREQVRTWLMDSSSG